MKTAIVAVSLSVVVASIFTLASPGVKSNTTEIGLKEINKNHNSQSMNAWCPVVGDGRNQTEAEGLITKDENGVVIYQHCDECRAGVITEHEDGLSRCTFCGKQAKNN